MLIAGKAASPGRRLAYRSGLAMDDVLRLLLVGAGQDDHEFVAAVATQASALMQHFMHLRYNPDQCMVVGAVAEVIIDVLEPVEADHEDADRLLPMGVLVELGCQQGQDAAAVERARQGIRAASVIRVCREVYQ